MSSRRKACDRCIQGKRRCDSKRPCTRCARRGLECTFQPRQAADPKPRTVSSISDQPNSQLDSAGGDIDVFYPWLNGTGFDFLNSGSVTNEIANYDLYPIYDHLTPVITNHMSPLRLHKSIRHLQKCVNDMAHQTQTPFLKVTPIAEAEDEGNSLNDAFLACTAYQSRGRQNSGFINRTLSRTFVKLIHRLQKLHNFQEQLCTVQAVLLFNIMFLFGDDDVLRQVAESHMSIVEASVQILQHKLVNSLSAMTKPGVIMHQYHQWLLLESCRRTIIAHIYIKGTYQYLRVGYYDQIPCITDLPLTVEVDLWDAQTEQEWCQVMRTKTASDAMLVKPIADAVDIWTANDYKNKDDLQMMLLECVGAHGRKSASANGV